MVAQSGEQVARRMSVPRRRHATVSPPGHAMVSSSHRRGNSAEDEDAAMTGEEWRQPRNRGLLKRGPIFPAAATVGRCAWRQHAIHTGRHSCWRGSLGHSLRSRFRHCRPHTESFPHRAEPSSSCTTPMEFCSRVGTLEGRAHPPLGFARRGVGQALGVRWVGWCPLAPSGGGPRPRSAAKTASWLAPCARVLADFSCLRPLVIFCRAARVASMAVSAVLKACAKDRSVVHGGHDTHRGQQRRESDDRVPDEGGRCARQQETARLVCRIRNGSHGRRGTKERGAYCDAGMCGPCPG